MTVGPIILLRHPRWRLGFHAHTECCRFNLTVGHVTIRWAR